eukprot:CAMPEP_0176298246 /NCGR_PEP_ID=MMETSP0121_2-20121125/59152_1 /TAXON_ID=160619 /ORGANISM="Kryptoperidinium foliaceum, Strain CCMP 1326" /LENGTH=60 /DNA_ID=CAMNT_0017639487 /DNA_START=114 /DNA_END=293 /DNA_ORIENTATION=-
MPHARAAPSVAAARPLARRAARGGGLTTRWAPRQDKRGAGRSAASLVPTAPMMILVRAQG